MFASSIIDDLPEVTEAEERLWAAVDSEGTPGSLGAELSQTAQSCAPQNDWPFRPPAPLASTEA